jgi:glucose uptake protein GlcU
MAEGLVLLFGLVAFVVFGIVLPVWTYRDAERNSSHSALLWALVVFFGGILGLILYFIVGRDGGGRRGHAAY